ncbi:hypothetical protein KIPB_003938 [Kipferlia bialata]|uniref:C2H2-type domain-containing protein n=1 Tax=Kipferlia bialata TaxID=797122 RepID=A0A9K3CU10_9EUKA|nr:hypothetical protein KIPB_003530 [Kipferlia bialata]GIQ82745.1 hypothetical protein KIPB_003938 [Kipferlia bialata]|eukprot:g3530.t1
MEMDIDAGTRQTPGDHTTPDQGSDTMPLSHLCAMTTCDETFPTLALLHAHYKAVHDDLPYQCPAPGKDGTVCGIRFQTRELLGFHLTTHREADKSHLGVMQERLSLQHSDTHETLPYDCRSKNGDGTVCGMRFGTRGM